MNCYIVRYGNYFPIEIDSIWETEQEASQRLKHINHGLIQSEWKVEKYLIERYEE